MTLIRNPAEHLADVQSQRNTPLCANDLTLVIDVSLQARPRFRQNDGAFSMSDQKWPLGPDVWGAGVTDEPQSDINGTAMA